MGGQLVFNGAYQIRDAVRAGFGLAYLMDDMVQGDAAEGLLRRVLADWCPPFSGYHLYYPSRRQLAPAFGVLVNALRLEAAPSNQAARSATLRRTS